MKPLFYFSILITTMFFQTVSAQCPTTPVIKGDTILCPGGSSELSTQAFETYQWFKRDWTSQEPVPIEGATQQSLTVIESEMGAYISVQTTLNGCMATSPEVLIDGWAFLLPYVEHTGDYSFDPIDQVFKICQGDTMFLTLNLTYDTLITWFRDGLPIEDERGPILAITASGNYTVEGAPKICPGFIQPLGLILEVEVEPCATPVKPDPLAQELKVFPNPVGDRLHIQLANGQQTLESVELLDMYGRSVLFRNGTKSLSYLLDLDNLTAGTYALRVKTGSRILWRKIQKI